MAGYKIKTHKGAAKRFRVTGSGRVKHGKAFGKHLLSTKSGKRMRNITAGALCNTTDSKTIRKMLPYQ